MCLNLQAIIEFGQKVEIVGDTLPPVPEGEVLVAAAGCPPASGQKSGSWLILGRMVQSDEDIRKFRNEFPVLHFFLVPKNPVRQVPVGRDEQGKPLMREKAVNLNSPATLPLQKFRQEMEMRHKVSV